MERRRYHPGVRAIISLSEIITFMDSDVSRLAEEARRIFFDKNFVFIMGWVQQIVIYAIFTGIIAMVVWRARRLVETQASTERERASLSRYSCSIWSMSWPPPTRCWARSGGRVSKCCSPISSTLPT